MQASNVFTAGQLVEFLSGEAKADSWTERRARLLDLQERERPGVLVHARRVAENARLLAIDVGMSGADADALHDAAILHDAGKIAVSEAVLYKNGGLDADERREIRMHAAYGFGLLDAPGAPGIVLDVAKYHHERYDGQGYFGVSGENIPYAARIAAVVDVHEAMTAKREYKASIPEGEVLSMMSSTADAPALGRAAFDPFLLRRFVAMRLRDPSLEATPAERTALEEFSRSDPMSDLSGRRDIQITRTGMRMHYSLDGGHRTLEAMTRPDGSVTKDFPRTAPKPENAPAFSM